MNIKERQGLEFVFDHKRALKDMVMHQTLWFATMFLKDPDRHFRAKVSTETSKVKDLQQQGWEPLHHNMYLIRQLLDIWGLMINFTVTFPQSCCYIGSVLLIFLTVSHTVRARVGPLRGTEAHIDPFTIISLCQHSPCQLPRRPQNLLCVIAFCFHFCALLFVLYMLFLLCLKQLVLKEIGTDI